MADSSKALGIILVGAGVAGILYYYFSEAEAKPPPPPPEERISTQFVKWAQIG
jgi:hypothetical protein